MNHKLTKNRRKELNGKFIKPSNKIEFTIERTERIDGRLYDTEEKIFGYDVQFFFVRR